MRETLLQLQPEIDISGAAKYTISAVSHGQDHLIESLLADLYLFIPHETKDSLTVIVTHNRLPFQQINLACRQISLRSIVNEVPRGFASNHNAAFAYCDTEWFGVLNPDIRLQGDVFSRLIAQAGPKDAVLAPALLDPRTGGIAPNRGLLTPWEILRRRLPGWRPADDPAWLPGAFLLIRAQAFREVGGFDERYFLYAEDFDLCARLRLAGWMLRYVPEVQVIHAAQRSSHVRWRYLLWHVQSLLRLWTSRAFWQYRALLRREARAAHRPR